MLKINEIGKNDIKSVSQLHFLSFKGFFLTSLGKGFLNAFYSAILKNENAISVGIFKSDKLVGFAIGTSKSDNFYKSILKKNFFKLGLFALPNLIFNPLKIRRLVAAFLSAKNHSFSDSPCLLSICVLPDEESRGLGSRLIEAFEHKLLEKGYKELILTTDSVNNDSANAFYKKNKYVCVETFFQSDRKMNLYHKKLSWHLNNV